MRYLGSIVLMFISSIVAYSQVPQKGEYRKNDKLDKFVGTWEGALEEGALENDRLKIILKKEKIYFKGLDVYMDAIIGWHVYSKNGKVIESSIEYVGKDYDENTTIMAGADSDNELGISVFHDLSRQRNSGGELKSINQNEAILTLRFNEQVLINKKPLNPTNAIPTPSKWKMKRIE